MKKRYIFLLYGLLCLCFSPGVQAQQNQNADPGSSGITYDKSLIQVNEAAVLTIHLGNFGTDPISANIVNWIINIPSNQLVTSVVLPPTFSLYSQFVDEGTTIIMLRNNTTIGAAPTCQDCSTGWNVVVNVKGQEPQGGPFNANLNIVRLVPTQVGNQKTANDNRTSPLTVNGILPVTLTQFNVTKEDAVSHLTWATTEESNSDYFEVQHSADAKNWQVLGNVKSIGESTILRNYNYTHTTPSGGTNYYRLRMVDNDNTFSYSSIRSVGFSEIEGVALYPNPVSSRLHLKNVSVNQIRSVEVHSVSGIRLLALNSLPEAGIDVSNLVSGFYVVKVSLRDGTVSSHKITVVK